MIDLHTNEQIVIILFLVFFDILNGVKFVGDDDDHEEEEDTPRKIKGPVAPAFIFGFKNGSLHTGPATVWV